MIEVTLCRCLTCSTITNYLQEIPKPSFATHTHLCRIYILYKTQLPKLIPMTKIKKQH